VWKTKVLCAVRFVIYIKKRRAKFAFIRTKMTEYVETALLGCLSYVSNAVKLPMSSIMNDDAEEIDIFSGARTLIGFRIGKLGEKELLARVTKVKARVRAIIESLTAAFQVKADKQLQNLRRVLLQFLKLVTTDTAFIPQPDILLCDFDKKNNRIDVTNGYLVGMNPNKVNLMLTNILLVRVLVIRVSKLQD